MWNKIVNFVSRHKVGLGVMILGGVVTAIGKTVMNEEDKIAERAALPENTDFEDANDIEEHNESQDEVNL